MGTMNENYFVNKFCTIFTKSNQKSQLSKEEEIAYFSGIVEYIDNERIYINNIQNSNLKTCFYKQNVIAICEEEILDPKKQKDVEIIESIKKANKSDDFVDVDSFVDLIKSAKIV